jgi:peptide/nickel transport system permease protein
LIRNGKLWFSGLALVMVHFLVASASVFAPYNPKQQHRDFPFAPPMRIHFSDSRARFHVRPFVCLWLVEDEREGSRNYREDCSHFFPIQFFMRGETMQEGNARKGSWHLFGVDTPAQVFLLGTDDYGRDLLSRLLYGGQTSLGTGLLAAGLSLSLGLVLGCLAGYVGSWVDDVVMRVAELFMALPWIYLLFAVRAILPLRLDGRQAFFVMIGTIGLTGWARPSRLIRGVVLGAKQRAYVLAARGFGASDVSIVRRHILPEAASVALTQGALLVPQYILAEVTFSFLGLGIGEPEPSWGNMLAGLQTYSTLEGHWWMFASGLALVPIFLLFYSFADSLQKHFQVFSGELSSGAVWLEWFTDL